MKRQKKDVSEVSGAASLEHLTIRLRDEGSLLEGDPVWMELQAGDIHEDYLAGSYFPDADVLLRPLLDLPVCEQGNVVSLKGQSDESQLFAPATSCMVERKGARKMFSGFERYLQGQRVVEIQGLDGRATIKNTLQKLLSHTIMPCLSEPTPY